MDLVGWGRRLTPPFFHPSVNPEERRPISGRLDLLPCAQWSMAELLPPPQTTVLPRPSQ